MLADFGADVVKVEDVGGDENRKWAPVVDGEAPTIQRQPRQAAA